MAFSLDLPDDLSSRWLSQRLHADLPADAERLLRAAGLAWRDEGEAERLLAEAQRLAPGHGAPLLARYRYHLYKHRFGEAAEDAEKLLQHAAAPLGLALNPLQVQAKDAPFADADPALRFWLWATQAYGYVLLRCERRETGMAVLNHLAALDVKDETKTRALVAVIQAREQEPP